MPRVVRTHPDEPGGVRILSNSPYPAPDPAPAEEQPERAEQKRGHDDDALEEELEELRNDGLYTPPSTRGTLEFPMTGGGVNWGGAAFDPVKQILYGAIILVLATAYARLTE